MEIYHSNDFLDLQGEYFRFWQLCGNGSTIRYAEIGASCNEALLCDNGEFIEFIEICDKINTCGRENDVCKESRLQVEISSFMDTTVAGESHKASPECFPGLTELRRARQGECEVGVPFGDSSSRLALKIICGTIELLSYL